MFMIYGVIYIYMSNYGIKVPVELAEEDALPGESPDCVDRDIP